VAKEILFYSRNISEIGTLKKLFEEKFPSIKFRFLQYSKNIDLSDTKIVINTTPLGMLGKYAGVSPVDQYVVDSLPDNAVVYDLVYNPYETELLKQAKKRDLQIVPGINMLVHQGLQAFELWTGKTVPDKIP
jgi:shikimate dehydrogenase